MYSEPMPRKKETKIMCNLPTILNCVLKNKISIQQDNLKQKISRAENAEIKSLIMTN